MMAFVLPPFELNKTFHLAREVHKVCSRSVDATVCIYEPVSIKSWILGFLLVIGICLFPLWPGTLRAYYLSLASFILFTIGHECPLETNFFFLNEQFLPRDTVRLLE